MREPQNQNTPPRATTHDSSHGSFGNEADFRRSRTSPGYPPTVRRRNRGCLPGSSSPRSGPRSAHASGSRPPGTSPAARRSRRCPNPGHETIVGSRLLTLVRAAGTGTMTPLMTGSGHDARVCASHVSILDRPVYGLGEAAGLLGLRPDRTRAWLDGYDRLGGHYAPVIREEPTGEDIVTWGEFVELGYLREYRRKGVPLQRLRPAIDELRREFATPYPLATARPYVLGKELVLKVQERTSCRRRSPSSSGQVSRSCWPTTQTGSSRRSSSMRRRRVTSAESAPPAPPPRA